MSAQDVRHTLILIEEPKAPDAGPPFCKWCGEEIFYSELANGLHRKRTYHRGDKIEIGRKNCRRKFQMSMCWSARDALRIMAYDHGERHYVVRCVDCNTLLETGAVTVRRRGGITKHGRVLCKPWHADHEIPLEDGGLHEVDNFRPRCEDPCHKDKTAREATARAKQRALASR